MAQRPQSQASMLPLADGSDMMGSLRTPAAFQGLVGFRPTPAAVPVPTEMDPMALGLVSIGPIARNVADATALFLTLSGHARLSPPEQTPTSTLSTIRIGWLGDAGGYWPTEDGILADCEKGLDRLASAGGICRSLQHAPGNGRALAVLDNAQAPRAVSWKGAL